MKQKALVLSTKGDSAVIEVARVTACEGCHKLKEGEGCVACSLFDLKRKMTATAVNEVGANPGDVVYISTPSRTVLFYSAVVFILPILIGLICYFVVSLFIDITAVLALASVAVIILTFLVIHFTLDRSTANKKMIRIVSVCKDNTDIVK
ncbi:MAG: SoxR reducing system RseC family protein [Clostridia bacterium]|nr:SoxR reducing system RseC family protein [Clostridia bacterium]